MDEELDKLQELLESINGRWGDKDKGELTKEALDELFNIIILSGVVVTVPKPGESAAVTSGELDVARGRAFNPFGASAVDRDASKIYAIVVPQGGNTLEKGGLGATLPTGQSLATGSDMAGVNMDEVMGNADVKFTDLTVKSGGDFDIAWPANNRFTWTIRNIPNAVESSNWNVLYVVVEWVRDTAPKYRSYSASSVPFQGV